MSEKAKQNKQEYDLKYVKQNIKRIQVSFNFQSDEDIKMYDFLNDIKISKNRYIKNLIKNTFVALRVLRKEKPDLVISSGAAVAVPFFYIAKLMGKKLIYIEVFDRIDKPTLTGKLVYPIVDEFIVQWDEMKKVYPKAINLGSIF